jgi:hypothetical protein
MIVPKNLAVARRKENGEGAHEQGGQVLDEAAEKARRRRRRIVGRFHFPMTVASATVRGGEVVPDGG